MFEKFPQLSDAQKQQIQSQLKQSYGEKALRGNLEMATAIFPESPVTIGDSWVVNTKLESGFDANIESTYKLNASNSSYCLISGSSTIKTINKDEYIQSNGMPMKFDLTGTMSDEIKINSSTGWVMESKINQTLKGTSQIKDNPKIPGGMTIPMEMKNEMTIAEK